jgi:uncharacterized protein
MERGSGPLAVVWQPARTETSSNNTSKYAVLRFIIIHYNDDKMKKVAHFYLALLATIGLFPYNLYIVPIRRRRRGGMQINVSQLLQEPVGSTREYDIDAADEIIDDGKEYEVRGKCRLMRTQRSILVNCTLDAEVELICSRCLSRFRHPLKIIFEEEYLPTVDMNNGAPLPAPEEAGSFTIDERHTLDLSEAVRQYALMAVPMKALCEEHCAGLCQKCGQNLNLGKCDCPAEAIDPRWSKLTGL